MKLEGFIASIYYSETQDNKWLRSDLMGFLTLSTISFLSVTRLFHFFQSSNHLSEASLSFLHSVIRLIVCLFANYKVALHVK